MQNQAAVGQAHKKQRAALRSHKKKCVICRHRRREAIEEAILHWRSPSQIAFEYKIYDRRPIYRHAHALGLFAQRNRQFRPALELIIEQAEAVEPTARDIIRAVEICCHMNEQGDWLPPAKKRVVYRGTLEDWAALQSSESNRHTSELEAALNE